MSLRLRINGKDHAISSDPQTPLLFVLRDELKLKGAKLGCGLEQCGACAVLVDGVSTPSCATPAAVYEGKEIVTVEGLDALPMGRRVQDAFVAAGAAQCGYCTAGLVVAATALLAARSEGAAAPDRAEICDALEAHLCRCGSHADVLRAIAQAAGDGTQESGAGQ
jgi:aerobic-type carbon monoxide dehydrogenase small subunit (CoxS/CutS family)